MRQCIRSLEIHKKVHARKSKISEWVYRNLTKIDYAAKLKDLSPIP